ncbi:MAG TPA: hypothetical protein PK752_12180 [Accumulibacter sp.]|uniref:hypothetical protein n=1 Tax=Accumulibacter sp. TaxID=2053492 RepID=UPI002BE7FDA3|nr:hypothetical protein [Accumulibacter sp.]HRD88993.1 hypothetical protein [Accumulibacter sp.]
MESASRLPIVSAALAILSGPALAKTPSDVADLVCAKGVGGETQLGQRGYGWVKNAHGTQCFWNASEKAYISLFVAEGRFKTITDEAAANSPNRVAQRHLPASADAGRRLSHTEGDAR